MTTTEDLRDFLKREKEIIGMATFLRLTGVTKFQAERWMLGDGLHHAAKALTAIEDLGFRVAIKRIRRDHA